METQDIVSISISSLAFLLSLGATIVSLIRHKYEKQRAIKKEITDILGKIVSTSLENAKLYRESAETDPPYYQAVSSRLNQQNERVEVLSIEGLTLQVDRISSGVGSHQDGERRAYPFRCSRHTNSYTVSSNSLG